MVALVQTTIKGNHKGLPLHRRLNMFKNDINFIGNRNIALIFSGILTIISIASLGVRGLQMGIDFTGGTLIEVGYQKTADLNVLRHTLDTEGFNDATV